ncbi:MAG: CDP-alcohol phosphatidyltransferase family protein [Ancalomicrobiaceae bacterium]|nr:CDP-alcohol phosphatidyltransferase family protein [Ancalomicrobiaceae bacterium]
MNNAITLPNLISILRLIFVPGVVLAITESRLALAFWLFVIAGASDAVDGFIARHWNLRSELGAHLDPLADKALLVAIYVTMAVEDMVPRWLVIIIVSRDVLIVGAVLLSWVLGRKVAVKPQKISKVNTAGQIVLAGLLLAHDAYHLDIAGLRMVGIPAVAALTVVSGASYLWFWLKLMSREPDPGA